jgi:APA family basic amino acid/polyamine antiporter
VALRNAGPSALVAFALNGVVALLTALSFAEMSAAFPESGGCYVFAKKVLSVRAAFVVGWTTWLAYVVAGVLYALGFAQFALTGLAALWSGDPPSWLGARTTAVAFALLATVGYAASLIRRATGGGEWATWGKLAAFAALILAGLWGLTARTDPAVRVGLHPFFAGGTLGVVRAMGFTFIALQGFEVIAAVAGEVREPGKTIPRAMVASLGCALAVYLPLLFVVSTAGVPPGDSIVAMSERHPETVIADAVHSYMGVHGFWLVIIAAVLSTLSALHANLLAASRIVLTMARDRTLPVVLGNMDASRRTPVVAVYASALVLVAVLLVVPDLAAAGAAASLIFLVSFALAHLTSLLARRRRPSAYTSGFRTPLFPAVQWIGGVACASLAVFQAVAVPAAGGIILVWLALGVLLYVGLFSSRAAAVDELALARDPELHSLRGTNPVVLVPVANPDTASMLVSIAAALAPPRVGRVLLMNVLRSNTDAASGDPVRQAQDVLGEALRAALRAGHRPQALLSVADSPWAEIRRVAREYACHGVLLGRARLDERSMAELESLMDDLDCHVAFLLAPQGWSLEDVRKILVPVGGRGGHDVLRARVLGSLCRDGAIDVTWFRVLPADASDIHVAQTHAELLRLAADATPGHGESLVERSDDPLASLLSRAAQADLMVVGLQRERGHRLFGQLVPHVATHPECATLIISTGR